jgi:hypothetical protein
MHIRRIQRVENLRLVDKYKAEQTDVAGLNQPCAPPIPGICAPKVSKSTMNEYFMFHGTSHACLDKICRGGFDPRRGGSSAGKLFGVGAYFAENASKADRYTTANEAGMYCMLVARVCLGATHMTNTSMETATMPPDRTDGVHAGNGVPLNSVTAEKRESGGCVDHREYIVYTGAQALPEFRIWYDHDPDCECSKCKK